MPRFTNETFLTHYLKDLTYPDVSHGAVVKNRHPEHWDIKTEYSRHSPFCIDSHGQHEGRDVWFWSDIHFNHKNIIRYAKRPYPTTELMNECLIGNYNNVIKEDDIVFWGGDITFGGVAKINEVLNKMLGYKIHIIGNHDMNQKGILNNLRFDEQYPCLVLDIDDIDIQYQILVSHYPLDDVPNGCVNLHGHIHQHILEPYHINMCVEHTNFTPMHASVVLDKANKYLLSCL